MKITYIAIAAAFVQVCMGGVLHCTGDQEKACRTFQQGGGDYYYCVCTADVSCQVGDPSCNSYKLQQCKDFCATKMVCSPGTPCPTPSHCTNLWMGGVKTYKCTQYLRS
ncbi:hypothetical protein DFQ26_006544 [Actinomortierella ambigua]|nr:hypothetical protein DFQ26_006544 [Actinomortierella ambigua]